MKLLKRHLKAYQKKEPFENMEEHKETMTHSHSELVIRKKDRHYLGMLEYANGDEHKIIRALIWDLKPRVAVHYLPGLPAYIIFMCIRYTDHLNDDNKVHCSFFTLITFCTWKKV